MICETGILQTIRCSALEILLYQLDSVEFATESFRKHDLIWMSSNILNSAFLRPLVQEMSIVVLDNKTQDMLIREDMNIMGLI